MFKKREEPGHIFQVFCCGKRRGVFPGNVLVCGRCDIAFPGGDALPNEQYARDVPAGWRTWRVMPNEPA